MEEAKRLVDKAYKERRERWGAGVRPGSGQGCPRPFREGTGSGEFVAGRGALCLSVFLSLGVRTFSKPCLPWPGLWAPRSKPCLKRETCFLTVGLSTLSSVPRTLGWGSAECLCLPPLALPPPSPKQHQAAASQWLSQPHGTPVLLQAAGGSHQDSCEGC